MAFIGQNSNRIQSSVPLSDEQIRKVAPSVFALDKHESRSARYTYIPTGEILTGLRKEGFHPFFAAQSRTRLEGHGDFTKHMLRFRHESTIGNGEEAREMILVNAHNGTSSYQLISGLLRFVCMNGLVTGDDIEQVRVNHKGDIKDQVIEGAYEILRSFEIVDQKVIDMKETRLLPEVQEAYAEAALTLKYDTEVEPAPISASQLLQTERRADNGNTTWQVFNRVQEHLVRGGQNAGVVNGRRRTTRAVNGVDSNLRLNRALWTLTSKLQELTK